MLETTHNSLINTHVGSRTTAYKPSANKYYNIFSKKMEEIDIPDINLEFNYAKQAGTSFIWTA